MKQITKQYPVIITEKIIECKNFYEKHFGFKSVFEEDWYIQIINDKGIEFGFMKPNLDNQPNFLHQDFSGKGLLITIEVEGAKSLFDKLKESSVDILLKYTEESWGQKHFIIKDPSELIVDIVDSNSQPSS